MITTPPARMRETMKIRFTKILRVCIVSVAILAFAAIGFISCGEKSSLSQITISPANPGMAIGTTLQLTGYGVLSNGVTFLESYLTWTSSRPDIASVDSTGLVTAGSTTGEITISATETDSHTYVSGSTVVTICTISSIELSPVNPSMAASTSYQFTATATLASDTTYTQNVTSYMTWTTSDSTIATVDSTGLVTTLSVTNLPVTITATQSDAITLSGDTPIVVETVLTVTDTALSSIAITGDSSSVATGSTLQLTATGTYADTTTQDVTSHVTWSSSDTTVATVDSAGLVTAGLVTGVSAGTVTVTATDPITAVSATIDITVN